MPAKARERKPRSCGRLKPYALSLSGPATLAALSLLAKLRTAFLRGAPGGDGVHLLAHAGLVDANLHGQVDHVAGAPVERQARGKVHIVNPKMAGIMKAIMRRCAGSMPGEGVMYWTRNMVTMIRMGRI